MAVSTLPSLGVGGLTSLTLKAGGAAFGLRTAAQAAQTWGLRGAAATSGLRTFGSMYGDAVQGYMSRGDSEATALNKAFIPALAGAASTYLHTAAGGPQGIEALLRQPAFKENFRQWFKAVAAGSVKEGLREEAPDQLIQGIIERYTYNPDKPWKDIIEETLQAGIGGALLGAGVEATTTSITPSGTNQDQPPPSIPSNTTPVGRPSTPPLSVEQSQKLIHNVMNRPPEQRGHPTTRADLAQAQWVVREHVRKLESQKEPLSEVQKKGLADAKSTLARLTPSVMTGLDELQSLPSLAGKTKAEIEAELVARGYTSTPANSGGTVWTKPGNDGTTSAVRIDPAKIRAKPKGYADEVPHVHKETVPTSKVDASGNYNFIDATNHNDAGNPSTDKRDTHISGGH